MSTKNKHNQQLGSDIVRSDDRIRETGEIFTPEKCIRKMIGALSEAQLMHDTFLDYCAGNGNFSSVLVDSGVPQSHIYGVEYMEDNFFEMCNRLGIDDPCYKLVKPSLFDHEEVKDSSDKVILKKGNYLRCDVFFPDFQLLFDQEGKLGYTWVPVE
jgi:hypothetical protein